MRAKVFCITKKFVAELRGKEGVRPLRNGGMEVECDLKETLRDGDKVVYSITPRVSLPPMSHFYELQLIERWSSRDEKNTGEIVTNFSGQRLDPRWRTENKVGFRTRGAGQLIAVKAGGVTQLIELTVYRLQAEGRDTFLVEERLGVCRARYDDKENTFAIRLTKEFEELSDAVMAAMEKAECQCWRKKCQCHYALTEEESVKFREERRARQRAAAAKTSGKPESKNIPEGSGEEEDGSAADQTADQAVPAPVE